MDITPADGRAPMEPGLAASLYLYDKARPTIRKPGNSQHVAVEVGRFSVVAWTPDTLRRYAQVCMEAADLLDAALAERATEEVPA